jgi:hypothetical protein
MFVSILKTTLLATLFALSSMAKAQNVERFDSAHVVPVWAFIEQGSILTDAQTESEIEEEIRDQLKFTVGQLNGEEGGSPDLARLEVKILANLSATDKDYREILYSARLFLAWPKELTLPYQYDFVLPAGATPLLLSKFHLAYGNDVFKGKKCLDTHASQVSPGIFWYYYRPLKMSCPLSFLNERPPELVKTIKAKLSYSDEQSFNKKPEYKKIWEDNRLIVVNIFGKATEFAQNSSDSGIKAYNEMVNMVLDTWGLPISSNIDLSNHELFISQSNENYIELHYQLDSGQILEIYLLLVDSLISPGKIFLNQYAKLSGIADFVSYSGHADLGGNIKRLASYAHFLPQQYQIYLINGCDTFAYVDEALFKAHQKVNPGEAKTKYLDLITNAMPSFFHMNASTNMSVIKSLLGRKDTYSDLLSQFDPYQRSLVIGEEDNF